MILQAVTGPVVPSGPAWAVGVSMVFAGLALLLRFSLPLVQAIKSRNGQSTAPMPSVAEARLAGGESATIIVETRENRKVIDAVLETVSALARNQESSAKLAEQIAALMIKSDGRQAATEEAVQAMSRMMEFHSGLLDKMAQQTDAIFERSEGSDEAIAAILKSKRRHRKKGT